MRYDVAGAFAQKSRIGGGYESKVLDFAKELSKMFSFLPEVHSIDHSLFGKCLRVFTKEGEALELYPEKELMVFLGENFSVSLQTSNRGNHMFVGLKDKNGLYQQCLQSNSNNDSYSVESKFWDAETLNYLGIKGVSSDDAYRVDTAADSFARRQVGELREVDYNSEEFEIHDQKFIEEEAKEKARLNSMFWGVDFHYINSRAADANILPDEQAESTLEGNITGKFAADIAYRSVEEPEILIEKIETQFVGRKHGRY